MKKKKWGRKFLLAIIIVCYFFIFYIIIDANKYKVIVKVIDGAGRVGVNPTTESLDFGDIAPGMSAKRRVNIVNDTFMPMLVLIWKTGKISDLIDINDQSFRLEQRETTKIEFSTYIPASANIDTKYDGMVYIFKIPTFGF